MSASPGWCFREVPCTRVILDFFSMCLRWRARWEGMEGVVHLSTALYREASDRGGVRRRVFSPHLSHKAFILSPISSRSLAFSPPKVCCPRVRGVVVVVVSTMLSSGCCRQQDTGVYIHLCVCAPVCRACSLSSSPSCAGMSTGFPTLSVRSSQSPSPLSDHVRHQG